MAVAPDTDAPDAGRLSGPVPWSVLVARRTGRRPLAVVAAFWVWLVVAALTALGGVLLCVAAVLPTDRGGAAPGDALGTGWVLAVGLVLLLAAAGVVWCALALRRGRPWARVTLSLLAVVLALGGLLRVIFQDPVGLFLVASLLAVVLMYLPSASVFFFQEAPRGDGTPDG